MSASIFAITVLNASSDQHLDVKFDLNNEKFMQFQLGPNEIGTFDDLVVNLDTENLIVSQRMYGTHTWFPLDGSPIVVQMVEKLTNKKVFLGGAHGSSVRSAITQSSISDDDIEYNDDFDDYDVTCKKCGMCFICRDESEAQNVLFQHLRDDHPTTNFK